MSISKKSKLIKLFNIDNFSKKFYPKDSILVPASHGLQVAHINKAQTKYNEDISIIHQILFEEQVEAA